MDKIITFNLSTALRVSALSLAVFAALTLAGCDKAPSAPKAPVQAASAPVLAAPAPLAQPASASAQVATSTPAASEPYAPASGATDTSIANLKGTTFDGKPYNLEMDRGKVILVMLSSSRSAIARDKQPELRANFEGWRTKGFQLVAISTDESAKDAAEYDKLIQITVPPTQQFPRLWRGGAGYTDNLGIMSDTFNAVLINREGKITKRFSGRISGDD